MQQVIDRKLYDTETAELIHRYYHGENTTDFHFYEEALHRTQKGAFFIAGSGGAMSPYGESLGSGSYGGGEGIRPVDIDEALRWLEEHGGSEAIINRFRRHIEPA